LGNTIWLKENRHENKNIQKPHSHSHYQILFVLNKVGSIQLNDVSYSFNEGTLVFIPPRVQHSIESYEKMTVLKLEFDREKLDSLNQELLDASLFSKSVVFRPSAGKIAEVKQIFRRMLYEKSKSNAWTPYTSSINLSQLFILLLKKDKGPVKTHNKLRASKIQEYIDTQYYEIYGIELLANKFQLSTRHITSIFKEQNEMTPNQYLNQVRINEAKQLLIETDNDIMTICFEVGYESLATFYRQFKMLTDLSPKVYRNQFKV